MNCRQVQERLAEDPKALQSVESIAAHVRDCPACRQVLARLNEVDESLQTLADHRPPEDLVNRTLQAVDRSRIKTKQVVWLKPALVTGLSILLLLGLSVFSGLHEKMRPHTRLSLSS